ncbi:hypothetical protein [Brumicola pallidula]|jgi:hypothetical protein|uniref:Lipoprotein n=1 Tax=Brumicola pallidula DSM 14239 = ACAM 615 TaxID=1121922 RepID=K6ZI04_9ALTE|nr:hypothetical protein [Glaciecola pallidula]GAC28523.1 hypothetical protein GPAL_1659 [Glaciecola pallidula DSM 14239 = ACAM 615]
MQQKKYFLGVAVLTILVGTGCSNKAAYELMMTNKKQACGRMAEGQAREDCLRGYEKTFKEYEYQRNRVVGDKKIAEPTLQLPTEKDQDSSSN